LLEPLLDVATGERRVSKPKGREYHDVSDPLGVKNNQENGRTTILVILLKLKIIRNVGSCLTSSKKGCANCKRVGVSEKRKKEKIYIYIFGVTYYWCID